MPSGLLPDPPRRLARSLDALRGQVDEPSARAAADWLAALPELLEDLLNRWELTPERVVSPGGRSSLVALVRRPDGTPAALKLLAPASVPARVRAEREAAALGCWDGWGAILPLREDAADGALLLERVHAEVSLRSLPEEKAMLEAASVLHRLWITPRADGWCRADDSGGSPGDDSGGAADGRSASDSYGPTSLTTLERQTAAETELLRSSTPEEAAPLRDEALDLRAQLLADAPEPVLLHGDFRQDAVLAADAGRARWLAAGPDPLLGERAYDLARLVRDRLHDMVASAGAGRAARRRLDKLADSLEVDRERLRGWTVYRAVVSGVRYVAGGDREDGELLLEFAGWL